MHYVKRLQAEINKPRAEYKKLTLKSSDGWMSRFKKSYRLSFKKNHCEAMSADDAAIASKLSKSKAMIKFYHPDKVRNAD